MKYRLNESQVRTTSIAIPFTSKDAWIDILSFSLRFTRAPWTFLFFCVSPSVNMKNEMTAIVLPFFSFLRFAKLLRIGNHLLLSCNHAQRTGQRKQCLALQAYQLAQISTKPQPQKCGGPGDTNSGKHFVSMLLFRRTRRNSCREQGWYSRLGNEIWAYVRIIKLF